MLRRAALFLGSLLFWAPLPGLEVPFKRGDANLDGLFDISDPVKTLNVLFQGAEPPGCAEALDSNDDGKVDISDGILSLAALFTGGPNPPAPYPGCGVDPTPDSLGCAGYPGCADCLDQADLDQALAQGVDPLICIPADAAQVSVLSFLITVCPHAAAKPCGTTDAPGCPAEITSVKGTLDLPGRQIVIDLEGSAKDLPILIEDTVLGNQTTCLYQIGFKGHLVVPFTAGPAPGGGLELTGILDPLIENVDLTVASSPGFLCKLIEGQKDQFLPELTRQLQAATTGLLADLRARFVGSSFCS
jgi:hypothetical protein